MELLLWSHANAKNSTHDYARELTSFGRKQTRWIAAWLKKYAPDGARLLVSPTVRTRQTAAFFRKKMEICDALAADASTDEILALLDWPNATTSCIVVGHQSMLGEIAAQLLQDTLFPQYYYDKNSESALWWFAGEPGKAEVTLRQHMDADRKFYDRADHLEDIGKYRKAFKIFRRLAEQGDTAAMGRVAHLYYLGYGVPYSFEKTVEWEKRAAEAGNATGMYNLGVTYRRDGDVRTARTWYERALAEGDGSAALALAKMYLISDLELARVKNYLHQALALGPLSEANEEEIQQLLDELENREIRPGNRTTPE
jgi:phosphohistidine phosphatase